MRMGKNDNLAPLKKRTGAVTFFAQDIAGGDSRENVKKLFSLSFSPSAQFLAGKRPPPFCRVEWKMGGSVWEIISEYWKKAFVAKVSSKTMDNFLFLRQHKQFNKYTFFVRRETG